MPVLPILRETPSSADCMLDSGLPCEAQTSPIGQVASHSDLAWDQQTPRNRPLLAPRADRLAHFFWDEQTPSSGKCTLDPDLSWDEQTTKEDCFADLSSDAQAPKADPGQHGAFPGRRRPSGSSAPTLLQHAWLQDQLCVVPSLEDAKPMVQLPIPRSCSEDVSNDSLVKPVLLNKGSGGILQRRRPSIKLCMGCPTHFDQDTAQASRSVERDSSSVLPSLDDAKPMAQLLIPRSCQEDASDDSSVKPVPPKRHSGAILQKRRPGMKLSIACPSYRDQDVLQASSSWVEQFDLLECLGQGSTGVVRRAVRKADKLEVAVKIMRALDEEMMSIRRQEFKLLQRIEHPHIVKAIDFFASQDQAVLVLGYFPSQTLDDAVHGSPKQKLSEVVSRRASEMLFQAIECLHRHRVVHRDIKAANILVSQNVTDWQACDLRLIDFNASRCMLEGGSLTMTGTMNYLPPEVLEGESPSESCDVWSAGLCLHMMLTGYLPWQSNANRSRASYAKGILSKPLCLEGIPWHSVSSECKAFLRLCLSLDKKLRPTPTTLLQHAWLEGSGPRKRHESKTLGSAKFATHDPSVRRKETSRQVSSEAAPPRSKTQEL
eukprot:TRINITY_DN76065_c0_g1_i1.p1 TRINITY_DN76065_c0_g1~~TRINITY_DN76065_c0_g1_i1.p1  ORF type:complete len:615 (-),score=108.32 TRINITY_DN76065_c0_g1_i1:101-1906(-)